MARYLEFPIRIYPPHYSSILVLCAWTRFIHSFHHVLCAILEVVTASTFFTILLLVCTVYIYHFLSGWVVVRNSLSWSDSAHSLASFHADLETSQICDNTLLQILVMICLFGLLFQFFLFISPIHPSLLWCLTDTGESCDCSLNVISAVYLSDTLP